MFVIFDNMANGNDQRNKVLYPFCLSHRDKNGGGRYSVSLMAGCELWLTDLTRRADSHGEIRLRLQYVTLPVKFRLTRSETSGKYQKIEQRSIM